MLHQLKKSDGFSLVELMMVVAIVAILGQFGFFYMFDMIRTARDASVRNDVINIMTIVVDQFGQDADVNYAASTQRSIGVEDTSGNPIKPCFTLSPGTVAEISGGSSKAPGQNGFFDGTFYHVAGSRDASTLSGAREFYLILDEETGTFEMSF